MTLVVHGGSEPGDGPAVFLKHLRTFKSLQFFGMLVGPVNC